VTGLGAERRTTEFLHQIDDLPGRAQHGRRYAVIVQGNDLMALSTVAICPTSQSAQVASFHPEVKLQAEKTKVLCEMVRAVDTRRLGGQVCHLSLDDLMAVDEALALVLALN
jgi:mRNA interferase MazF